MRLSGLSAARLADRLVRLQGDPRTGLAVMVLWCTVVSVFLLRFVPANLLFPDALDLKTRIVEYPRPETQGCKPLELLPDARLQSPGDFLRDPRAQEDASRLYFLVTYHENPSFAIPVPLKSDRPLYAALDWAVGRAACRSADQVNGLNSSRLPDPAAASFDGWTEGACPLAVLPSEQVNPGFKVLAGPFGLDGTARDSRELLEFTVTGYLSEPAWLQSFRQTRKKICAECTSPLRKMKETAGRGRVIIPLGPDWRGLEAPELKHGIFNELTQMLVPPIPVQPLVFSNAALTRSASAALRRNIEFRITSAWGILCNGAVRMDSQTSVGPRVIRSLGRTGLAIWEVEIDKNVEEAWLVRFSSGLVENLGLAGTSPQDYKVVLVHWLGIGREDGFPNLIERRLLNLLAERGFDLVVGLGASPDPGTLWSRGNSFIVSNLGAFSGAEDILAAPPRADDLGLTVSCTTMDSRPFQCYLRPVLRSLGETIPIGEPRKDHGALCLWREDEWYLPLRFDSGGGVKPGKPEAGR